MRFGEDAACLGLDDLQLFGPWHIQMQTARQFCSGCPVRTECAEQGKEEAYGLWGGLPEGSPGRPSAGDLRKAWEPTEGCEVDGCDRPHAARGLCNTHHQRLLTHGDVRSHIPIGGHRPSDADVVLEQVARESGVPVAELVGRSRARYVVWARHRAMARLRDEGWSLPAIGEVFGRDHTTVLHGIRRMEGVA